MLLRHFAVAILFAVSALAQTNVESAKRVSDGFIADVAANRTDAAIQRWHGHGEQPFERQHADTVAKSSIHHVVEICGRPVGATALVDGKPENAVLTKGERDLQQQIFLYRAQTSRGVRRFEVTVQPDGDGGYHVSGFGCGKLR